MIIGKYLLGILAILILLSIVSTLVMYYLGIGARARKKRATTLQDEGRK